MYCKTIEVGMYEVNCTIFTKSEKTFVVDPGAEPDRIIEYIHKAPAPLYAILLTHAHFDHIGAISALQRAFPELPVFVTEADAKVIAHPMNQLPPEYPAIATPGNLHEPKELAEFGIEAISTPGHTPGGVCYLLKDEGLLFSGDTLFSGSIGRTDLPGGNMATLMDSLNQLKTLDAAIKVIPGHGSFTTIGDELNMNPFLQG